VQFVDGDCEIAEGWLDAATAFLDAHPEVAAVCGRRRERYPERSIYNLLCDIDWDRPTGETRACGGDAMIRCDAFRAVGGYNAALIAGEDPELCVRLRAAGWRIWRLAQPMTLHDAVMTRFTQWWTRAVRTGYVFAQGAHMHGRTPDRYCVRESRSAWLWGLGLPLTAAVLTLWLGPMALALLVVYPLQVTRLAANGTRSARENWWSALFLVLGKLPEAIGQVKFLLHRYGGTRARLIEYK
jgi:GT2 family glycosyltransferase